MHIDANREWGGGQAQSLGLALALAARGEKTSFIAQSGSALCARLRESHLPWESMSLRGLAGLGGMLRLARRLRDSKPDVVHVHDGASLCPTTKAAAWAGGPRLIATRRTEFPVRRHRKPIAGWLGWRRWAQQCDRVICISEAVKKQCLAAGLAADRLVVIPDFVDCRHFAPGEGAPIEEIEHPTIAIVGRLAEEKGHRVLLRAMASAARTMPKARLLIAGEGAEEENLQRQAEELGISDHVKFLGFVPDVRSVLSAADLLVMPSLSEGLGVAALEAMAMGKPVVASNVGGLPESVLDRETGMIVPAGNAGALAGALAELLRDSERAREMGEAGRERALRLYDRPRVVERIVDLYHEVSEADCRLERGHE